MFPRRFCCSVLTVALLSGCAFSRKKAPLKQDPQPLRLGRVALVNEAERFALIETFSTATPEAGTLLRIFNGAAVSAELRATNVRRRPFLVADLVNGAPTKGDLVFQPHGENPTPPRAEPVAAPSAAPAEAPAPRPPAWRRWLFPFGVRK